MGSGCLSINVDLVCKHEKLYIYLFIFHQGAELGPRPEVKRGKSLDDWDQFLDPEGRVTDPQKVKELVFRGVCLCFTDLFLILLTCHKPVEFPLNKTFLLFLGHCCISAEGGMEVLTGVLPMEQHKQRERGHP